MDQTVLLSKGLGTQLALESLFLTCVHLNRVDQTVLLSKGLGTQLALERFYSSVHSTVDDLNAIPSKGLKAS